MWRVLGVETSILKAGQVWKDRVLQLSKRKKGRERFLQILDRADVNHWFDAQEELHVLYVQFPKNIEADDLKLFKDFVVKVMKGVPEPVIEYNGIPQRFTIVMTSEEEEDVYQSTKTSKYCD
jgi:hypothetical protein